jgi:hypothetical protein
MSSSHAQDETRCRDDAIISAKHCRTQPADVFNAVSFAVRSGHNHFLYQFQMTKHCGWALRRIFGMAGHHPVKQVTIPT